MAYRASSKEDLKNLALALKDLPAEQMVAVQSTVTAEGLMLVPFPFNLVFSFIEWRHGKQNAHRAFWTRIYNQDPASFGRLFGDTIRHMLLGKDREEKTSVGGFSQRELDIVIKAAGLAA